MIVNALVWTKFIFALLLQDEYLTATSLFLLSHAAATCSYLAAVFFLQDNKSTRLEAWIVREE